MTRCNVTLPCGAGYRLVKPPGECCAKCEESNNTFCFHTKSDINAKILLQLKGFVGLLEIHITKRLTAKSTVSKALENTNLYQIVSPTVFPLESQMPFKTGSHPLKPKELL